MKAIKRVICRVFGHYWSETYSSGRRYFLEGPGSYVGHSQFCRRCEIENTWRTERRP